MNSPEFSIIILNYNYAAFLPQAIDSALGQKAPGCEVIVVDDASTDNSQEIIAKYATSVTPVLREQNGGMSAAANEGYLRARGRLVMFLDADDFLYPESADRYLQAAEEGVAQIQCRLDLVEVSGRIIDVFPPYEVKLDSGDVTAKLRSRGRYATSVTSGLAFSRAALDAVMPIPEKAFDRSADGYLAAVVPFYGKIATIETPNGAYRRHGNNHSGFGANLARRARWATDHDQQRYAAMRTHAAARGLSISAAPSLQDPVHLEQRLASLCFDPSDHPYPGDERAALALRGARASFASTMSLKRRAVYAAMFLAAGFTPLFIAKRALAWKLEQSSRPRLVNTMARHLRRLLG